MKNVAASVRDRLSKVAEQSKINFQLLLIRYFQERLLYRLSISDIRNNFCLKGGALVYALKHDTSRPTLDLDFLGIQLAAEHEVIRQKFELLCAIQYELDGVVLDATSIATSEITKEGKYPGIRVKLTGQLGNIRQLLQIDIGFGDVITPGPVVMQYPTILDMEAPELKAYSTETVIAEKFEAMIDLGEVNSRMKDFYDLHNLLQPGTYDQSILEEAIKATFHNRETTFLSDPAVFQPDFYTNSNRQVQWAAFLRKSALSFIDFTEIGVTLNKYLKPIYERCQ